VGTTADALPLRMEPATAPRANGSAASLFPVGQAWKLTFGGTFQNTFRLRLPSSGTRTDFEIHHYDDVAGVWQRLGHSRVGSADGWVEADVNADGVYSLFAPPVYMSHHHSGVCGALGLEAALALGLIRLLRRGRC
jgi:hypothetical protein